MGMLQMEHPAEINATNLDRIKIKKLEANKLEAKRKHDALELEEKMRIAEEQRRLIQVIEHFKFSY